MAIFFGIAASFNINYTWTILFNLIQINFKGVDSYASEWGNNTRTRRGWIFQNA